MAGHPMKLLIALDEASDLDAVLSDLSRAGIATPAEALVLTAADVMLPAEGSSGEQPEPQWLVERIEKARARAMEAVERARGVATRGCEAVQSAFPRWAVRAEAAADSPAWAIVKKAREEGADLIVVGSQDRSRLKRLLLGSVSQAVLHHADGSVRIARNAERAAGAPLQLMAGDDGSADAEAALDAVAKRAWPEGTTLHLVTAVDETLATLGVWRASDAEASEWMERLNQRSAKLRAAGLAVMPVVSPGDPRRILLEQAERCKADCIFVGARGLRRVERLLLGSVSSAIAARAACSVEVVRFH